MNTINKKRARLNVSQSEMAALMDTSIRTYQGWESGKTVPPAVLKLADVLCWLKDRGQLEDYRKML